MESGSTAVITFISNNQIIYANWEQNIIPLSCDHKSELPEEKKE